MDVDQFTESLAGLLPTGHAWPRSTDSVLMAVVRANAGEIAEHTADVHAMVTQWQPHTTVARLAEWEASCGLPDQCVGQSQTENQRRTSLLRTLRGPVLPLSDSSPAAPAVIEAACAEVGFSATVRYNTPFRVGRDRVGNRLGALDGQLYVTVHSRSEPLRVGSGRISSRLVDRGGIGSELECYLDRLLPARFQINVIYE